MVGLISTTAENLSGELSSSVTSCRSGSSTGLSCVSARACRYTSGIRWRATSWRTSFDEVQLDHAARDLALAEAGQLGFPLHAGERALPRLRARPRGSSSTCSRRLHAPSSSTSTFIAPASWNSGTRGGSRTPTGVPLWILSPARLPVPPLSHVLCNTALPAPERRTCAARARCWGSARPSQEKRSLTPRRSPGSRVT